ncbi:MAG: chemotaxis protein CheA, partial [Steroidobacteraceae bacterium]
MAGIRAMGDVSHELESFLAIIESDTARDDAGTLDVLQASLDELHRMRELANSGVRIPAAAALLERIRAASAQALSGDIAGMRAEAHGARDEAGMLPQESATAAPATDESVGDETVLMARFELPAAIEPAEPAAELPAPAEAAVEATAEAEAIPEPFVEAILLGAEITAAAAHAASQPDPYATEATGQEFGHAAEPALPAAATPADVQPGSPPAPPVLPGREPVAPLERAELARVDAELLDELLNNAGEVSIFRARLEQQMTLTDFNLAELDRTVTRLREQLRKLEIETEAQILHRHQGDVAAHRTDFDPLELDRYSTIQQLSRALAESVSDVASIEGLLANLNRETQNLLQQQGRVVTEVQNGLMRTRMVPFQRHVQRLTRLLRQAAAETGKKAELVVEGASGELDRQVLERMLPPFEHMLRNAVVHGIETPDGRAAAGKPETGRITMRLQREGAEVVIVIEDDGAGLNVPAIIAKARQIGLLDPGQHITEEEALQLVLEPGFSTADRLTQQAGRGVGMDVVATEVKKLGGGLFIESKPGYGARFTIRLQFPLAITQALIVRVHDE